MVWMRNAMSECPHYLATCGGLSGVQHGAVVRTPAPFPPPDTCPLHYRYYTALPGVMCYAHNNIVMCDNRDIDGKFCKIFGEVRKAPVSCPF